MYHVKCPKIWNREEEEEIKQLKANPAKECLDPAWRPGAGYAWPEPSLFLNAAKDLSCCPPRQIYT